MKNYHVDLSCEIPKTFLTTMATNSVDLPIEEKSSHRIEIQADIETDFNVGLIFGSSGSGKTSLAKQMFGEDCNKEYLDLSKPVIEQFPKEYKYEDIVDILNSIGLSQVPCWVRPAYTLSNGQRARAEVALAMSYASPGKTVVIDEWTSVVDRTVGKVMSHAVSKFARMRNIRLVFCSCHYDVFEFLNPDWIINLDLLAYEDRRLLRQEFKRTEKFTFTVRKVGRKLWKNFSYLHYLASTLPGGLTHTFGLFNNENCIGFMALSNYVPHRKHSVIIYHCSRIAIRPDFLGLGLGIKFTNAVCKYFSEAMNCEIRATYSSKPMFIAMSKNPLWKLQEEKLVIGKAPSEKMRKYKVDSKTFSRLKKPGSFRGNTRLYRFKWIG